MGLLAISYDLYKEPGRAYKELFKAIQSFPSSCHALESAWFVATNKTPQQAFDVLRPHLHRHDKVLITPVAQVGQAWWINLPQDVQDWLRQQVGAKDAARRN